MNEMTTVLDQHVEAVLNQYVEDLFTCKVSHAALENAAGATKEKANFTLGACTGLSECPACE